MSAAEDLVKAWNKCFPDELAFYDEKHQEIAIVDKHDQEKIVRVLSLSSSKEDQWRPNES